MKIFANVFFLLLINLIFAQNQTVGVFQYDENQTEDGYVLFAPTGSTTTYLIDNCGHLVNSWESEYLPGLSFYLLENGDMIRAAITNQSYGFNIGGRGGRIERFNWEGDLIWEYEYANDTVMMHHDFKMMPNGNIVFIAWKKKSNAAAIQAGFSPFVAFGNTVWPEQIVEIEPLAEAAEIVWQWDLWDHLIQDYNVNADNFGIINDNPRKFNANTFGYGFFGGADMMHFNALDYNEDLDQIIISARNAQEIYIIDHNLTTTEVKTDAGDFLWRWGNAEVYNENGNNTQKLFRQHDVNWIKSDLTNAGKIIVFNNGLDRPGTDYTSIEIIEPPLDANNNYMFDTLNNQFLPNEAFYTYDVPTALFNRYEGSASYLPNGNLFITSGVIGHIIEVNPQEEIVWEYVSPVLSTGIINQGDNLPNGGLPDSYDNSIFRAYKYQYDYAGFENNLLVNEGPIEINPLATTLECNYQNPDFVAINELDLQNEIQILRDIVSKTILITHHKNLSITIYNVSGKVIKTTITNTQIDLNNWKNGLYILKIEGLSKYFKVVL